MTNRQPFVRTHESNKPTIVGARWWQEGMVIGSDVSSRRAALGQFAFISIGLASIGVVGVLSGKTVGAVLGPSDDDARQEKRDSLAVQRDFGWNFGSEDQSLTFDGQSTNPFDRAALASLDTDLAPGLAPHQPYYVRTLFQSPTAMPKVPVAGQPAVKPLSEVLQPIATSSMLVAYRQGKSLATLFAQAPFDTALLIDLPGPEAVAFAAGLVPTFDPIFTFDNWPHPLGVVRAHLTLAAAAYYQPLFTKQNRLVPGKAPVAFVLDRQRLATYTSESTEFDNRYLARVPGAENLRSLGVKNLLYVAPTAADSQEMDDLNADLVACKNAGLDVKMVAAGDFQPAPVAAPVPAGVSPDDWPPYFYGSSSDTHEGFWLNYGWRKPRKPVKSAPSGVSTGYQYVPTPRTTSFSGVGTGMTKTRPSGMGMAPVFVSVATGLVVGAAVSRSGSFGRYSGYSGG
jgi:hypothetical protein